MTNPPTDDTDLPPDLPSVVAAEVRHLAGQLHEVLGAHMRAEDTPAAVLLLWHAAKLLTGAAGGLDLDIPDPAARHVIQWSDVADMASDIADMALEIAAAGMDPAAATARQERVDVDALDWPQAAAYAATVDVCPPDLDGTGRTITVAIDGGPGRALTVTDPTDATDAGPCPCPHTAASLLRTAHHLHRLGAVLGDVVDDHLAPASGPA